MPLSTDRPDDAGVVLGDRAAVLDGDLAAQPVLGQRGQQAAELLAERQERLDLVVDRAALDVDGRRDELAGEREVDVVGDLRAGLVLGLLGGGAEVRGDHRVGQPEQRRVGGRLGGEHVDGGAGDHAVTQRVGQCLLVDDAAAGDVEQPGGRLHQPQPLARRAARRSRASWAGAR